MDILVIHQYALEAFQAKLRMEQAIFLAVDVLQRKMLNLDLAWQEKTGVLDKNKLTEVQNILWMSRCSRRDIELSETLDVLNFRRKIYERLAAGLGVPGSVSKNDIQLSRLEVQQSEIKSAIDAELVKECSDLNPLLPSYEHRLIHAKNLISVQSK